MPLPANPTLRAAAIALLAYAAALAGGALILLAGA